MLKQVLKQVDKIIVSAVDLKKKGAETKFKIDKGI